MLGNNKPFFPGELLFVDGEKECTCMFALTNNRAIASYANIQSGKRVDSQNLFV